MLKTTVLVDTDSCAVRDVYCSAYWPHDTQTGRRVVPRNTEKPESLAGDKGYDDQSLQDALRSEGVRLLLRHRLFAHYDHAHNVRLGSELYGQRWMAEPSLSHRASIRLRCPSPRMVPEFRQLVLTAAVYALEQVVKSNPYTLRGFNGAEESIVEELTGPDDQISAADMETLALKLLSELPMEANGGFFSISQSRFSRPTVSSESTPPALTAVTPQSTTRNERSRRFSS